MDGARCSTPRPSCFTRGKETRYPLYTRLGGSRAGLDSCIKYRPYWDSIPGPSSPQRVAIPILMFSFSLYFIRTSLFWLFCILPFVLAVQHSQHKHPCPPARFEPATPASDGLPTLAVDCSATGIGCLSCISPRCTVYWIGKHVRFFATVFRAGQSNEMTTVKKCLSFGCFCDKRQTIGVLLVLGVWRVKQRCCRLGTCEIRTLPYARSVKFTKYQTLQYKRWGGGDIK